MISLTYQTIGAAVRARVALHHHLTHPDRRGDFFTADHDAALRRAIDAALADTAMALLPMITDLRIDDSTDTIEMDISGAVGTRLSALRPIVEAAIISRSLQLLFAGIDEGAADEHASGFANLIDNARTLCGASATHPVKPCWY